MRSSLSALFLTGVAAFSLFSCAKSEPAPDESKSEPTENGDDGDTEVAQAVPMALLGSEAVADLSSRLAKSVVDDTSPTPIDPVQHPDEYVKATVGAGSKVAGQLKQVLSSMQSVLTQTFGADGYFRGKDLPFKAGVTERIFKQVGADGNVAAYLVVRLLAEGAYRYAVDFFPVGADDTLGAQLTVEFTPEADGKGASVHYLSLTPLKSGGVQHLDASYETLGTSIQATFGNVPSVATAPAKTHALLSYDAGANSLSVAGAYVWDRPGAKRTSGWPLYYSLISGDIESFALRTRLDAEAAGAQRLFFQAAGTTKPRAYPEFIVESELYLVRNPAFNSGCTTTGDAIRTAFGASALPDLVQSAPADLCQANTAFTDAQLMALLKEACSYPITLQIGSASLCPLETQKRLLANPQFFIVKDGARVLAAAQPVHSAVSAELAKIPDAPLAPLAAAYPVLISRPLTEFAAAEDRPE